MEEEPPDRLGENFVLSFSASSAPFLIESFQIKRAAASRLCHHRQSAVSINT